MSPVVDFPNLTGAALPATDDPAAFLRLVGKTHLIQTEESFANWCRQELRAFIPFDIMLCASGRLFGDMIVVDELVGVDFPSEFIAQFPDRFALSDRWIIQRWLASREPQLIEQRNASNDCSPLEYREFTDLALRNLAAHGLIAPDGLQASYFVFCGLQGGLDEKLDARLRMVVPHLHQARTQVAWRQLEAAAIQPASRPLTPRESEVLQWIVRGKTNDQIAFALGRSAQTIKHQVASVLAKLHAKNRTQAVSNALAQGLVNMQALVDEKG